MSRQFTGAITTKPGESLCGAFIAESGLFIACGRWCGEPRGRQRFTSRVPNALGRYLQQITIDCGSCEHFRRVANI